MRALFRILPLVAILAAYGAEDSFPTNSLRIVAVVDGSDELHISHGSARWMHKSWQFPTEVEINAVNGIHKKPAAAPITAE